MTGEIVPVFQPIFFDEAKYCHSPSSSGRVTRLIASNISHSAPRERGMSPAATVSADDAS